MIENNEIDVKENAAEPVSEAASPTRREVWRMFDRIAQRYDLLNRLLSLRQDVAWRNKLAENLTDVRDQKILDLATGTADVLLSLFHQTDKADAAAGIDMSDRMLRIGREKIQKNGLSHAIALFPGDAMHIPFRNNSFDAVTIAFGIRNVLDVNRSLREMYRTLKPGGRVLILEFSLPANRLIRQLYLFYFRNILPRIGGVISGDSYAYRYLNRTVETFPYGEAFCELLRDAGFQNVRTIPLTFGIASIYRGNKR
ncbi:MAG: bifunctional demethylmenaquinone methyltransferase/2-methoxy-6-polyprenyl-1,4-benzoquinol methylase UbiE [Calditrichia bacterium]